MMRKFLFLLIFGLLLSVNNSVAQNSFCNFIVGIDSKLDEEKSHLLIGFRTEGLTKRDAKKVKEIVTLKNGDNVKIDLKSVQTYFAEVCRYKKFEIDFIEVKKTNSGVYFILRYVPLNKETKSKQ